MAAVFAISNADMALEAAARNSAAKARLEHFRKAYLASIPEGNFDRELWQGVTIESADIAASQQTGSAVYSMIAPDKYCNFTHNMMGGAIATILDGTMNCSIALVSRKGYWDHSGVSRSSTINYISPVVTHTNLKIECSILRVNKTSITIQGIMRRKDDGKLLAMCVQDFAAIEKSKL